MTTEVEYRENMITWRKVQRPDSGAIPSSVAHIAAFVLRQHEISAVECMTIKFKSGGFLEFRIKENIPTDAQKLTKAREALRAVRLLGVDVDEALSYIGSN